MKLREDFDLVPSIVAGLIVVFNLALLAWYAWLWLTTPGLARWFFVISGCIVGTVFGVFIKKSWEEIFPWVSKKTPTSSSTSLNQAPFSFTQYLYQTPGPSLNAPSPNVSPSLPEFTADTPLVGYREWNERNDGLLWSINDHVPWSIDRMEAKCTPELGRAAYIPPGLSQLYVGTSALPCPTPPMPAHSCGLYLLSKPSEQGLLGAQVKAGGRLYGAVVAWGRVVRHQAEGFRAQYAKVLCLTMPEWLSVYDKAAYDRARERTERAAKAYGVPVIPSPRLAEYASEFGTTADKLAIPETATA